MENTRVVSDSYNCFSVWSPDILLLAAWRLHAEATALASHWLCAVVRAVFHALEVNFLHCLQFLLISETGARSARALTYLISLRLDVPFGVLKELVDILSEHLLEVSVVDSSLVALRGVTGALVLRRRVSTHCL